MFPLFLQVGPLHPDAEETNYGPQNYHPVSLPFLSKTLKQAASNQLSSFFLASDQATRQRSHSSLSVIHFTPHKQPPSPQP